MRECKRAARSAPFDIHEAGIPVGPTISSSSRSVADSATRNPTNSRRSAASSGTRAIEQHSATSASERLVARTSCRPLNAIIKIHLMNELMLNAVSQLRVYMRLQVYILQYSTLQSSILHSDVTELKITH